LIGRLPVVASAYAMVRNSETAWQPGTLNAAVEEFLDSVESGTARDEQGRPFGPARVRELSWALDGQVVDRLGSRPLAEIGPFEVEGLLDELADAGVPSERLASVVRSLCALYDYAAASGLVAHNPAREVELPEAPRPKIPAIDRAISLSMQAASLVLVLLALYFLAESL
jgi:site-specific recombinase XerD